MRVAPSQNKTKQKQGAVNVLAVGIAKLMKRIKYTAALAKNPPAKSPSTALLKPKYPLARPTAAPRDLQLYCVDVGHTIAEDRCE